MVLSHIHFPLAGFRKLNINENAQQVVASTILSVRAIAFQQPQMQVAENRPKNHKRIPFHSPTIPESMNYSHANAGGLSATPAKQIIKEALTHTNGINHQIISDLRADLILLLQEHKELQLHSNVDMWKFVLEINHCLNTVAFLLDAARSN